MKARNVLLLITLLSVASCGKRIASNFQFPDPVNTNDHPISLQEKKTFAINGVYADNNFDGARLNDFVQIDDSTYSASILPENFPINKSPWYAFKLWADEYKKINLILNYEKAPHRYKPKVSQDGENWALLDSTFINSIDSGDIVLELELNPDTLWLAGQEVINSSHVKKWCIKQAEHSDVTFSIVGKSKLGRDMYFLEIGTGEPKGKDIIIVISRQHPPEVTGYMAMEAFIEKMLSDSKISRDFREKYRILVFPLMNPDGVDLGHWRHNAGGIDMNRDWGYYRQPETRLVADYIVKDSKVNKGEVLLGLDFHSTYKDLYYTFDSTFTTTMYNFHDYWIENIGETLPEYQPDHRPGKLNQPISKGWFLKQFNAESITYEVGDNTPRDFIRKKGETAAVEMMKLIILR